MRPSIKIGNKTIRQLSQESGVPEGTIYQRWKKGMKGKALIAPNGQYKAFRFKGKTLREWSEETGFSIWTLRRRYHKGCTLKEFLAPAPRRGRNRNRTWQLGKKTFTTSELADMFDIRPDVFLWRMNNGWEIREALEISTAHGKIESIRQIRNKRSK